jgi:predicted component of type VI protein secretion system
VSSIDLKQFEEVVERAVRRVIEESRSEDVKAMADAIKALADYVRFGFQEFSSRFDEVESNAELGDVGWLFERARIIERILNRRAGKGVDGCREHR